MALVHISGLFSLGLSNNYVTSLIEDPNPSNNRLFLSGHAHDGTYLTPVFGQSFHYNSPGPVYQVNQWPYNNNNGGLISTQKASINCYVSANASDGDSDQSTAFHRSLDPVNYPAKRAWYTLNNRVVFGLNQSSNIGDAATNGINVWLIYPNDITQGYLYLSGASLSVPNNIFYEDPINNKLWGLSSTCGYNEAIVVSSNYDNPATIAFTNIENQVQYRKYFLGADIANNT